MSKQEKIICLGKEFNSEEERREYFRNELRTKLPELKKIEGFPIGEDEDIINLSDPPYYTACPNPWLNDFIAEWEKEKENIKDRKKVFHVDEPYASDVSEGKYDPMYLYHPYLTKVPHKAILKFILHYTQPGDIVLENNNQSLVVNDFSLAKSVFSLWPRTPSLSKDGNTISFAGGVPGGFSLDKAILFNIISIPSLTVFQVSIYSWIDSYSF